MRLTSRRAFAAGLVACLVTACAGVEEQVAQRLSMGIKIEAFAIHNGLSYPVTDVTLTVPETGRFIGCGNILPRSACRSAIQSTDYSERAVQVRWKEHGESRQTDEFNVDVPSDMSFGTVAELEVVIFAPGQAGASLVRKSP